MNGTSFRPASKRGDLGGEPVPAGAEVALTYHGQFRTQRRTPAHDLRVWGCPAFEILKHRICWGRLIGPQHYASALMQITNPRRQGDERQRL